MGPNTTNLTADDDRGQAGIRDSVLGYTLLSINVFIVVLNTLAVMVIIRFRTKNAVDVFVLALAMTDLVKGLIPVPVSIYIYLTESYLKDGSLGCDLFGWTAFTTNSASMLILALMAAERFFAVVKPFAYRTWVSPRRVTTLALIAVLFSAFYSAWPLLGMGRMLTYNGGAYCHFDYSKFSRGTRAYSIFTLVYGFCMIAVVMASYSFVFYKIRGLIRRHRRMSVAQTTKGRTAGQLNLHTEKMFSYLTVVLMLLFWFSWLPFLMVVFASQIGTRKPHKNMDLFAIRIAVVNSMLNPLACAALCKPYRRGIVYYLRVVTSFVGFAAPESDVFDPWHRGSTVSSCKRHSSQKVVNAHVSPEERRRNLTQMFIGAGLHGEKTAPDTAVVDALIDPKADGSHGDVDNSVCLHSLSSVDSDETEKSEKHTRKPLLLEKIQNFLNAKTNSKHEPLSTYCSTCACSSNEPRSNHESCDKLVQKACSTNAKLSPDGESKKLSDTLTTSERKLGEDSSELGLVQTELTVARDVIGSTSRKDTSLSPAHFKAWNVSTKLTAHESDQDAMNFQRKKELGWSREEVGCLPLSSHSGGVLPPSIRSAVPSRLARTTGSRGVSFDEKMLVRNSSDEKADPFHHRPRSLLSSSKRTKMVAENELKDSLTTIDRTTRVLLDFSEEKSGLQRM